MAASASLCDSYVQEILQGIHQAADAYMVAVYTASASLGRSTTVYSATNEVPNSGTYVAGGQALVGFVVGLSAGVSYIDWTTDPQWTGSIAGAFALVYNATRGNKACAVYDFGGTVTSTGDPFILALPPPGPTAMIHIANP